MSNLRFIPYFLLPILLLGGITSCNEEKITYYHSNTKDTENLANSEGVTGEPIELELVAANKDSILEPTYSLLGPIEKEETQKNVFQATSPRITLIKENVEGKVLKMFEAKDSLVEPETTVLNRLFPDYQVSQEPNYKDNAFYNIQYIDGDQGLGTSYIFDVVEDSRGNLWIATWGNGVVRFDGFHFYFYDVNWGLRSNYVWNILEDKNGHYWFGTDGYGLHYYDGDGLVLYNNTDGLTSDLIYRLYEDSKGILWIATDNGLNYFDGKHFYSLDMSDGLPSDFITSIYEDSENRLWIGTDNGACYIKDEKIYPFGRKEGLNATKVAAIYEDNQQNIWFGTEGEGVIQFDGYSFFQFTVDQGFVSDYVNDIISDNFGNVWFGTEEGVCMFNRMEFVHFSEKEGISHNLVRTMLQDSDGNLWFGTFGGGLNKFNENSFENFSKNRGLKAPIVRSITQDRNGDIWLAHNSGLSQMKDKEIIHYDVESGLSSDIARCVIIDSKGGIWIGMNSSGASYFDGKKFTHYDSESGLSSNQILCVYEDRDSNVWFGTGNGGITMFDGDDFYYIGYEDGLSAGSVRSITEDNEGNLWFATLGGGAVKYNEEGLTRFTMNEGLGIDLVTSFLVRDNGDIWLGTEGEGITILKKDGTTEIIRESNGLSDQIVWSLVADPNGTIWAATEEGINAINFVDSTSSNYQITTYGKLDGLKGLDFFPNSVCLDNQSRIWWGSGKSLVMLDLNKYERRLEPPRINISNIEIDQTILDFRKIKDSTLDETVTLFLDNKTETPLNEIQYTGVQPFTNLPTDLVLPYDFNNITIHFAGIDWSAPHKLKYQYRLDGLDKKWSPLKDDKKAILGNLSSGDYTFRVRTIGEAQMMSEEATFSFTILSPWYERWYAYLIYIGLLILLIYVYLWWRTKSLREKKVELEEEVDKRTAEVVQQKELVEFKNKEITASINYAKRIQTAILPAESFIKSKLPNSFVFYLPKDIVAGDFYWAEEANGKMLIAAADCTGHGVPGAMVSVVCHNALNRTVREFNLDSSSAILNKVRDMVINAFSHGDEEIKDGMDIALVSYDFENRKLEYSGAYNDLYLVRNKELQIFKANKQPVGKYMLKEEFTSHFVDIQKGDTIYIFTDGYADQFGGPNRKKFKYKPFADLLVSVNDLDMEKQKNAIVKAFEDWKGDVFQIDDVCVIGIRF
ncbi:MAG: SpoIIE family protein phosphatase [Crocinitomicaceae bacterium]|nr:SpoIIE family protein phosphatase [Crocinitomicaceae bacterium]